jgi:hypothetical protein
MAGIGKQAEHLEWQSLFYACYCTSPTGREEEWGSGKLVITLLNGVEGEVMETHYSSFYQLPVPTVLLVILLHHSFLHICL